MRPEEPSFAQRLGSLFRTASSDKSEQPRVAAVQPAAEPQPKPAAKPGIVSRVMGLRGSEAAPAAEAPTPKPRVVPLPVQAAKPGAIQPQTDAARVKTAAAGDNPAPAATPSTSGSLMRGSQPIPSTSSFDSRWSGFR
jgi:hypothetical protein